MTPPRFSALLQRDPRVLELLATAFLPPTPRAADWKAWEGAKWLAHHCAAFPGSSKAGANKAVASKAVASKAVASKAMASKGASKGVSKGASKAVASKAVASKAVASKAVASKGASKGASKAGTPLSSSALMKLRKAELQKIANVSPDAKCTKQDLVDIIRSQCTI